MTTETTIYVQNQDGAMCALSGRRLAKLKKELAAGRGGFEVTQLVMNGYQGFLGTDGQIWDFEALKEHFANPESTIVKGD